MAGTSAEGTFATRDKTNLYTKSWKPEIGDWKAVLIFVHGFSDHINAYYDFFPRLASSSIAVYGFDQRGWGRSVKQPADQGLTGPTSLVLSDLHDFIKHVASLPENKGKPLFLMGHSMGGGEVLCYMLSSTTTYSDRPKINGILLEAPYIELDPAEQPNFLTVFAGKLVAFILPQTQLKQKLSPTYMSRSAKVRQEWVDDPLCHDTGTFEGLKGLLQRAADLSSLATGRQVAGLGTKLPCPLWHSHGEMDKVVSPKASKRVFDALQAPNGDKLFKSYPGTYHKLHAEPDGFDQQYAKDVSEWILAHIGTPAGADEGSPSDLKSKL